MDQSAFLTARDTHRTVALIADRDPDTRSMYAEFLAFSAFEIIEATDGREALAKAISRRPDIIVTDTRLPGMDGYELCGLLRRDVLTRTIPIVIVTGDAYPNDIERARSVGADAVLVKPCLPDRLLAEVHRVLTAPHGASRAASAEAPAAHGTSSEPPRRTRFARSHSYERMTTTMPPVAPPALICPDCDLPLTYVRSHVGGVSSKHPEQWDYYQCEHGCGTFQFRARTRKLRRVS